MPDRERRVTLPDHERRVTCRAAVRRYSLVFVRFMPAFTDVAAPSPSSPPTINDENASLPMANPTTVHKAVVPTPTATVRLVVHDFGSK